MEPAPEPGDRLSEEFFQNFFLEAGDGIFLITVQGIIIEANPRGCEMLGFTRQELIGKSAWSLTPADEAPNILQKLEQLKEGKRVTTETEVFRKDNTRLPVETTAKLLSNGQMISIVRDNSERKLSEQALIESEHKYRHLVEHSPDGIIVVDESGHVIEWNSGQQQISGLKESEVLGRYIWDVQFQLTPKEQRSEAMLEKFKQRTLQVLATGQETLRSEPVEAIIQSPAGTTIHVELMMYTYKTALGYRVGSIVRDITKRKQVEVLLEHMAMHDALTDLPNRLLFENRLIQALDRAKREPDKKLAVMLLDLDHFKEVNDMFGHAFGDQLLKVVGQRLQNCLRKSDTAARMGGDEFALINEAVTHIRDIELIAEKVSQSICMPVEIEGHILQPTTSIGITTYIPGHGDAGQLLREADLAMYDAKRSRNCFRFYRAS